MLYININVEDIYEYICIDIYICKNLEKDLHISNLSIKFGLKGKGNH